MLNKFDTAKKIIEIANNNDGRVYGEFVHGVIVPKIYDEGCDIDFEDVDIWFRLKHDFKLFIKNLLSYSTSSINIFSCLKYTGIYSRHYSNVSSKLEETNGVRYAIHQLNKFIFNINIVYSDQLPVDDFDVNQLTYILLGDKFMSTDINSEKLINNIKNKFATMLPTYNPSFIPDYNRLHKMFFDKGWMIKTPKNHNYMNKLGICINKIQDYNDDRYELFGKVLISQINDEIKDVNDNLMVIFNIGLKCLTEEFKSKYVDNKEFQIIYKRGLDECQKKFYLKLEST